MTRFLRSLVAALMRSPARHVLRPVILGIDRVLWKLSGGRLKLSALMIPSLVLVTVGAKTGLTRETALMCFPQTDGSWIIAGSNFGREEHPGWSANLLARPQAHVHYRNELVAVTARLLSQDEADELWPTLERQWPRYRAYEKTAKRSIRVFSLTRSDDSRRDETMG